MSLFCWESLAFFRKIGIDFNIEENDTFTLTDVRLKLKIFENKYSKAKNMILNCDYLQDYIFKNKLKFDFMKNWNIHYNLGIMFNEKKEIVGNSQYAYYIFQDNKLLKRKIENLKKITNFENTKKVLDSIKLKLPDVPNINDIKIIKLNREKVENEIIKPKDILINELYQENVILHKELSKQVNLVNKAEKYEKEKNSILADNENLHNKVKQLEKDFENKTFDLEWE